MTWQHAVRVCTLPGFVEYERALQLQRALRDLRVQGMIPDTLLCLQHSPAYTVGKRGAGDDFLAQPEQLVAKGATVTHIERGGQVTFHGPGQWVCYPVYHLRDLNVGARTFIRTLEQSVIAAVGCWGLQARGDANDAAGVWVGDEKVGAIGVHISRGVAIHGIALNVNTDLEWYSHIVPCGHRIKRVTTLQRLLQDAVPMEAVRRQLVAQLTRRFGFTEVVEVAAEELLKEL